jgi:hypothetical protein
MMYSSRAEEAHAFLQRHHTDLTVYVEDSTCSNSYRSYFKRILNIDRFRVHKIGSKSEVISFYENRDKPKPRKYICIIDGDYGYLFDSNQDKANLHYLRCYCSENLLISKDPIYEILEEIKSDVNRDELELICNFDDFINSSIKHITKLMIAYALSHKFAPGIETTGASILRYTTQPNTCNLSSDKINAEIKHQVSEQLKHVSAEMLWNEARVIRKKINEKTILKSASGKSMIMPIIFMWLKSHGFKNDIDSLKVRMAKHCALNVDTDLLQKIEILTST